MAIPKECKRLAEVDFPIAAVGAHAAREKSLRHGHPSTLHLWWARRPLASSRAVLLALLLPDPCDPNCPVEFKQKAAAALPRTLREVGSDDKSLREALLRFISDFADWDKSVDGTYLAAARGLVRAAYGDEPPLLVDPFAGGGSIPFEAVRVGCGAFASDLNPVACLILRTLLEEIPNGGPKLLEELRAAAEEVRSESRKELTQFYPPDEDGASPIAFIWARTIRCEAPKCGAEVPLARSFWLSKKADRRFAVRFKRTRGADGISVEVFQPKTESEVARGTVAKAKATCPVCEATLPPERVRSQLAAQRGGADVRFSAKGERVGGATLLAVVTAKASTAGRNFRSPTARDYSVVWKAQRALQDRIGKLGSEVVPVESLPPIGTLGFRVQRYGMESWGDLFTSRQKLALSTFSNLLAKVSKSGQTVLPILMSRLANGSSSLCRWNPNPKGFAEKIEATFSRQALSVTWDFAETSVLSGTSGDWQGSVDWLEEVIQFVQKSASTSGQVQLADARAVPLPDESAAVWFTDPPYYDAVPYSDLSDFFFVWLKRSMPGHPLLRDPFDPSNPLTPKAREAVQDETKMVDGRPKDRAFFETAMAAAFSDGRRVLGDGGIGCVVFAHKTTEGWEALLSGLVKNGFVITASWPLSTEMGSRLRARESAALGTSVHLVCRPRSAEAPDGDWAEVLRELPEKVGTWMDRLSGEGVRGADLVFACIGPAMEVYSRYSVVVDAEDREIPLGGDPEATEPHKRGYLAYVWEVVARLALERVLGKAGGGSLEEDARLTALFLWTLQASTTNSNGGSPATYAVAAEEETAEREESEEDEEGSKPKKAGWSLPFDVARRFAQPLGIHLDAWEGRILETEKGIVRLLPVAERKEQLFGSEGIEDAAEELGAGRRKGIQLTLTDEGAASPRAKGKGRKKAGAGSEEAVEAARRAATTLDRVHAAMLLQSAGQTAALRTLLTEEKRRGPDFERLSNALAALYPRGSEERRLVEAMLLAMPR